VTAAATVCPGCANERVDVFEVVGMDCAVETRVVEQALRGRPGICSVRTSAVTRQATVVHTLAPEDIRQAIEATGFEARAARRDAPAPLSAWTTVAALVAALTGVAATLAAPVIASPAFAAAVMVGGWPIARRGWRAVRHGRLEMNALMTVAVVGAGLIGEWDEAAATVVLFSLAQLLESRALERARRALSALMRLAPEEATVRGQGGVPSVHPVAEVAVGAHVLVGPGQRVPLDGIVAAGESELDESPLTGESTPAAKRVGDEVFAGSINGGGALDVRVSRPAADTTLARIVRRVEEAQASRAPSQGFVERFAAVYTPIVLGLAVAMAVLPPLLHDGDYTGWIYRALVLLVVSCPCALVLATPVSIVSALTAASRRGLLIKGGAHLEAVGRVCGVAFDKTGTLTHGSPAVTDVVPVGVSESELLQFAAAVEARSGHSLGRAVVEHAQAQGVPLLLAEAVTSWPGRGVRGLVEGRTVRVGSHRWFDEEGLCDHRLDAELARLEEAGRTAMLVEREGRLIGYLGVADRVRDDAAPAVAELEALGLAVALLTGDNARTAKAVADRLGVGDRRAELLPDDKVAAVRALQERQGALAMVGDGVNDAPALATAAVGVAIGPGAADATLETADIVLLHPDLRLVPEAIRLGRATRRVVRQNVAVALVVKGVVLGLALAGLGTLWAAVAADMGASLLVIANGLRLLRGVRTAR
jgi:Cd2+/Zn2+-exporting ATPase